ncbi:MAG: hypothetical protein ACM3VT_00860 [Solirubrobacterales bacterium]
MKKVLFLCALMAFAAAPAGASTVINFDDLTGQASLPAGYAGLEWSSGWWYYDWAQAPFNPASGATRLYNSFSDTPGIDFSALGSVTFEGAYFAGRESVYMEGYLGGTLVGTSSTLDLDGTPTFLAANFGGNVDMVRLHVARGSFVMDDVTYSAVSNPTIPAPAALVLGSLGAGLVGWLRRRSTL